jgi:hypothetical protein
VSKCRAFGLAVIREDSAASRCVELLQARQSVHLLLAARPARGQLATIVVFHLWVTWPDLLFRAGEPHERWMDYLALGHVSSHYR